MIKKILSHPLTLDKDIDCAETTRLRRLILQEKPFLKQLYEEWYMKLIFDVPENVEGSVLELGSGAGFFESIQPNLITSDILFLDNVGLVMDGHHLPIAPSTLKAILLINVFHHLKSPHEFLEEASRCINNGGVLSMIEPWFTPWSRQVYQKLHHEPFHPESIGWEIPSRGPLSGANGALPWIIFQRDIHKFKAEFPTWEIVNIELHTPFRYLLSGGLSMRSLMPGWTFRFWSNVENILNREMSLLAMFAKITLLRSVQ
jgi:SAM-dependent methyltransferase